MRNIAYTTEEITRAQKHCVSSLVRTVMSPNISGAFGMSLRLLRRQYVQIS